MQRGTNTPDLARALTIEGWMNESDLTWLAEHVPGHKVVVEVGSFLGRSTTALLDNASEGTVVYAVDDFYGPREPEIEYSAERRSEFYETFLANMREYIDEDRLRVIKANHNDFRIGSDLRPDMVFIDGAHDAVSVVRDITLWLPRLLPGGLLSGHDYHWWPAVKASVDAVLGAENVNIDPDTDIWYIKKEEK
jgi:predicted O-methyltransferase YrrM